MMQPAVAQPFRRPRRRDTVGLICVLFLGLSVAVRAKLGPTLLASDVIVLLVAPIALYGWHTAPSRVPRSLVVALLFVLLWLFSATISNLVNGTSLYNWVRGLAIIIVFGASLLVISVFIAGNRRRERVFAIGLALGLTLGQVLEPEYANFSSAWKFQLGLASAVALAELLDWRGRGVDSRRLLTESAALGGLGIFSLLFDYRSLAGFLLLAGLVGLYKWTTLLRGGGAPAHLVPDRLTFTKAAKPVTIALFCGLAIFSFYSYAVSHDWLGQHAAERIERMQVRGYGKVLDTLIGSRPQFLISTYAIAKRPIVGYGSWPQNCGFIRLFKEEQRMLGISEPVGLGYQKKKDTSAICLIPSHSHLLGAWLWAGLMAVPVWLYIMVKTGTWMMRAIRDRRYFELAPLVMGAILLWAIPFSPFAGRLRITEAFYIAVIFSRLSIAGLRL